MSALLLAALQGGPYDPDPEHLWNRLHQRFFTCRGSEGRLAVRDEVDPLVFVTMKHHLFGSSHEETLKALDQFLAQNAQTLIQDPVKKAVFQNDVWALFQWASTPNYAVAGTQSPGPSLKRLRDRLAGVLARLALARDEISKLPDTYRSAAASGAFPAQYDPERPEVAFLPRDLFQKEGPWIPVGPGASEPAAPFHQDGRSIFLVFIRLPGGARATLDYLTKLRAFERPSIEGLNHRQANPELPQFPEGTLVALVRQMAVFDQDLALVPTEIVQSVEIRVYRKVPKGTYRDPAQAQQDQLFFEFDLSREKLFAGTAGGLRAVAEDEPLISGRLMSRGYFPDTAEPPSIEPEGKRTLKLRNCSTCHGEPGIFSLKSFGGLKHDFEARPLSQRDPAVERRILAGSAGDRADIKTLRELIRGR